MAGASAGELRLVDRVRVELSRRFPEGTQRTASAGVVPDARDHDSTSPDHPRHLVQPGDRIRHEVDDELGERRIEAVVGEGEGLSARPPNLDPGVPLPRRSEAHLGQLGSKPAWWVIRRNAETVELLQAGGFHGAQLDEALAHGRGL